MNNVAHRVVITGMGAIAPLGLTVQDFWQGCVEGRSGVVPITKFDCSSYPVRINGEVQGFDAKNYMDYKDTRRTARFTQFAVAAAHDAIADSGLDLDKEDRARVGVLLGNGNGGIAEHEEAVRTLVTKGGMRMDPFYMLKMLPNVVAWRSVAGRRTVRRTTSAQRRRCGAMVTPDEVVDFIVASGAGVRGRRWW